MSREKQIKEMANILWHIPGNYFLNSYNDCERIAECIYDDGDYRKQSKGEWVPSDIPQEKYVCSVCGGACWYYDFRGDVAKSRYCPNCGAKMFVRMTHTCPHNIPNLIPTIEELKGGAE